MASISQIRTREEALSYYLDSLRKGVLLDNAFAISINLKESRVSYKDNNGYESYRYDLKEVGRRGSSKEIHIVGLSIPELGVGLVNDDVLGYVAAKVNHSNLSFAYSLPVPEKSIKDPFLTLYQNQMEVNSYGAPMFVKVEDRPIVQLLLTKEALFSDSDLPLVDFIGCKFSYPKYAANLSGNSAAVFTVSVAYHDYKINKI